MAKQTKENSIEKYFVWWIQELKDHGYIIDFVREPEQLLVDDVIKHKREKHYVKKRNILEEFNLFRKLVYTYDFKIIWAEKAQYYFYEVYDRHEYFRFGMPLFVAHKTSEGIVSKIDVKPTSNVAGKGGRVSTSVTFPYKQRLIFKNTGVFINKAVPIPMAGMGFFSAIFIKSFTPMRYFLTDGGKMKRKIHWKDKAIPLENYLSKYRASHNMDNQQTLF